MLCECLVDPNILVLPLTLLVVYLTAIVVSLVNTSNYFQKRRSVYGGALVDAHLAFSIVGCVAFFCVSSVLWLWSSKYSFTHAERMWRLCVGVWFMCFCKDLPLTIIETHAYLQVGWQGGDFMDASFILQIIFFVPSGLVSSATISWYVAGFLERQFGNAMEVAVQEKSYAPPLPSLVCAELAAATSAYPPPLPMQEMHYTVVARPPRVQPLPEYPAWFATEPTAPPRTVAAEHHRGAFIRGMGDEELGMALNNLRELPSEDGAGGHPTVI